jgi:hypothetical protein
MIFSVGRDFSTFQVSGSEGMNTKVFEMTYFPTTVISREARLTVISREARLTVISREARLIVISREARLTVISREARPRNLLTSTLWYPVASCTQGYPFARDFSTFQVSGSEGMNTKVFEMTCFPTTVISREARLTVISREARLTVISREARPRNLLTSTLWYSVAYCTQGYPFARDFSTFQVSGSEGMNTKVFEMTHSLGTLI